MSEPIASGGFSDTLVIGLGNPILGDDGIGWCVADVVASLAPDVEVDFLSLGGLSLMERLIGYRRAIIIDAIQTRHGQCGDIHIMPLDVLPDFSAGHTTAVHDTSLRTAINLGQSMGADLPSEVIVVGIEAERIYDFSDELSPPVEAAISIAAQAVLNLLAIGRPDLDTWESFAQPSYKQVRQNQHGI
ncbi:MAG: hydrogenase maturation protease [Chloroflexota bacterium]